LKSDDENAHWGGTARRVGFAYCYGYINAALQTIAE